MTGKKIQVEFAPGCFDGFEGTQEELDGLIQSITQMAESGAWLEMSTPLTEDDIMSMEPEDRDRILLALESETLQRRLQ